MVALLLVIGEGFVKELNRDKYKIFYFSVKRECLIVEKWRAGKKWLEQR